ncbi:MAG: ribose-phosphate pyrophosphokinase [Bradyrhizobiaceae bacterium]|nr:ribose-phosphate pyrophosphokinase [Bradyrhizobiaceae bacterium]
MPHVAQNVPRLQNKVPTLSTHEPGAGSKPHNKKGAAPVIWSASHSRRKPAPGGDFCLFALQGTAELGETIAKELGVTLSAHEEREFEDGEHKVRPLDPVRGKDVYVVHSLHGGPAQSANDKLCRLLFFIGALKDAGAARVTAVTPYLCYARKDRRTKPNDPVTTRYVAQMLESVGTDCIVTLEVHNPVAFENAFRCRTVTLTAATLFVDYVRALADERIAVVSPDPGGVKRADLFREALEAALGRPIGKGFVEKRRSAGVVSGDLFVGEVEDCTALVIDDLISTGNTLLRAARAARQAGARRVIALVTHGLFMQGSAEVLADPAIDQLVLTDAVPPFRLGEHPARNKIVTLPAAPLLAEAIGRLHRNETLADLLVF